MLAIKSWIVMVICTAQCIFAEKCLIDISGIEPIIKDMIDTQGYFCSIPVQIVSETKVTSNCDRWALIFEVDRLLEKLRFKHNTNMDRNKSLLIDTYKKCLELPEIEPDNIDVYLQTVNLNPIQILERVNESLHKLHGFEADSSSFSQCTSYYEEHRKNYKDATKCPPCTCPSPTTPISSSETSKASLNYLSEHASSTFTTSYSYHTSPSTENISTNYSEKLKKAQGLNSSPSTPTDPTSELKPLTTIMDHSYVATTVKPEAYTDSPLTNPNFLIDSTELTTGIYKSSYVSLNPSDTRTVPEQETSDSGTEGMYESVMSSTIETTSLHSFSPINGEVSTVMEPDETQETTMSEVNSQSSKGSLFQNSLSVPSKDSGIETSSIPVTKKRRSLVNVDAISREVVMTQSVSSLSTSANDPKLHFTNSVPTNIPSRGIALSNSKAPDPVSQGKVIGDKNLGWASFYLSTTMLTTKTELSISSATPGGQRLLSDVTHNPVSDAHKSYNIVPQKLRDKDMDSFSDPPNPPMSTKQTISIVVLVALVLLFLCGLLYYRHQYWVLKRRLDMSCNFGSTRNPDAELPEENVPLPTIVSDIV